MIWNKMRSTISNRWKIPKFTFPDGITSHKEYQKKYPEYNGDLRPVVPKNTWFWFSDYAPWSATVRCECGYFFQLSIKKKDGNHTIDKNGIVSPSIGHYDCGFHEWGILEDWEDGK